MKHFVTMIWRFTTDNPQLIKKYVSAILWALFVAVLLFQMGQGSTLVIAILTGGFFLSVNYLRNAHLETQLSFLLHSTLNFSTATFEDYLIMLRNRSAVTITVRELRMRKTPDRQKPGQIFRFKYKYPSYCVVNNDPDEDTTDYVPHRCDLPISMKAKLGMLKPGETYEVRFSSDPGDFHQIPPEAGAIYSLPLALCKQFTQDDIHDCLLIVEYPTIFGQSRVITIHAAPWIRSFIQRTMRDQVRHMADQEKKMLEQSPPPYGSPAAGSPSGEA